MATLKATAITTDLSHGLVLSLNKLFCELVACALPARWFQPSQPSISQPFQALALRSAMYRFSSSTSVFFQGLSPSKVGVFSGGSPPQKKISATFIFTYWSKMLISSSNWHDALVNSSHLKCSSKTMGAWNLMKLQDLMSNTLHDTFQP